MGTTTALSAAQQSARTADKLCFIGGNLCRSASSYEFRYSSASHTAGDQSSTTYPKSHLIDGHRATQGRTSAVGTSGYLLFDFGSDAIEIDCMVIEVPLVSASETVLVEASSTVDGAGLLNGTVVTVQTAFALSATRLVLLWNSSYAYRYWTLTFTGGGNIVRGFRQVWLGKQYQLNHALPLPIDPLGKVAYQATIATESGHLLRTSKSGSLALYDGELSITGSPLDDHATMRALYTSTTQWASPFWLIAEPKTAPNSAYFGYLDNGELQLVEQSGAGTRAAFRLRFTEQGAL